VKLHHRHGLETVTSNRKSDSVNDANLFEERSCQISSRSDLKRRNLGLFKEEEKQEYNWQWRSGKVSD